MQRKYAFDSKVRVESILRGVVAAWMKWRDSHILCLTIYNENQIMEKLFVTT